MAGSPLQSEPRLTLIVMGVSGSGDKRLMRKRVAGRSNHYVPASLIDSQFAALEPPAAEGDVVTIAADADAMPDALHLLSAIHATQFRAKETP